MSGAVEDAFDALLARGVKVLVSGLEHRCDPHLNAMAKTAWDRFDDAAGDTSAYMRALIAELRASTDALAAALSATYFRFFATRLVQAVVPRFVRALHRCRRVGFHAANALLLDVHAFKTFLLEMSCAKARLDGVEGFAPPKPIVDTVNSQLGRAELLLKVLSAPSEALLAAFVEFVPQGTRTELKMVADLRGLKKSEVSDILNQLEEQRHQ